MTPGVSIILPTHNRPELLQIAVGSVLAQTRTDFELLVVGDGCSGDTGHTIASFDDPRIRFLDLPKAPGFGYANRNVALRESRGGIIAYLADDDLWFPDHLEIATALLDDPRVEFGHTRGIHVSAAGYLAPIVSSLDDPRRRQRFLTGTRVYLVPASIVHRRTVLDRYGYWNESMLRSGDHEYWRRIVAGGDNVAFSPVPTAFHFYANWRKEGTLSRLWHWLRHEVHGQSTLKVDAGGGYQQLAVWRALTAADGRGAEVVRRALVIELDRMAAAEYPALLAILALDRARKALFS